MDGRRHPPFRRKKTMILDRRITCLSALICALSLAGCGTSEINQNKIESRKVDSLIKVTVVNDRTLLVRFGYDAMTAINTSGGIVVIDAGISTFLAARYKKIIESGFDNGNFVYVINTHGHTDHVRGNVLFHRAQVIGQENWQMDASAGRGHVDSLLMRIAAIVDDYDRQLKRSDPNTSEWDDSYTQKIRYSGAYLDVKNNIPFRPPDIIFADSMNLECGDTGFEMFYFGSFHSRSDILIYSPENGILFIGDLFSKYGRPGMSNQPGLTDEDRWMKAIKWINRRINDIETIIDGHGQILTIDDLRAFNDNLLKKYSP